MFSESRLDLRVGGIHECFLIMFAWKIDWRTCVA